MDFTVSNGTRTVTTTITEGNGGGFKIEVKGGINPEVFTAKGCFTTETPSDQGVRSFIETHAPGLHSPWFKKATKIAWELKGPNCK